MFKIICSSVKNIHPKKKVEIMLLNCCIRRQSLTEVEISTGKNEALTRQTTNSASWEKKFLCSTKSKLMEWEIKEWTTELRENDMEMDEQNQQIREEKKRAIAKTEECQRAMREHMLTEKERMLSILKIKLETKERDIEGKAAVLNIAIKSNEMESLTRFKSLEKRFEKIISETSMSKTTVAIEIIRLIKSDNSRSTSSLGQSSDSSTYSSDSLVRNSIENVASVKHMTEVQRMNSAPY